MTRLKPSLTAAVSKLLCLTLLAAPAALGSAPRGGASNEAAGAPTGWTPDVMMKYRSVGAVRVSPDGRRVAYAVNEAVMTADKSEYVSQIHLANADGSESFQATFGEKSSTNPDWSPDGKWLAFTSPRAGKNNLYVMRAGGGEAEQLTDVKSGVGAFGWSPDSKSVAFMMADQPGGDEEKRNKGKDDWRWVDESLKMNHLYIVAVAKDSSGKREPRQLTKGDFNVGGGPGGDSFDWSPDGQAIVFARTKTAKADDWPTADLSVVDVASGEVKSLAATGAAEAQPRHSPDGKWVALTITSNPPRWAGDGTIHLLPAGGGAPKPLASSHDEQPNLIGWSADGKQLYFSETRGTTTALYAVNVSTNAVTQVNKNDAVLGGINLNHSRTMFGLTRQTADQPGEAWVARADNFAPTQVSRANADYPKLPVGKTEVVRWKSKDGTDVEGLLSYPVDYKAGTRVPLLLVIHGGPMGVFTQTTLPRRTSTRQPPSTRAATPCCASTRAARRATGGSSALRITRTGAAATTRT
jgi:dipeptidyl aminopeptidase/acylaminoacyl peptidase